MTPRIPTSDEGKRATSCCLIELRELADASDRKGEGQKGKPEMQQLQRAYLPAPLAKEISSTEGRQQAVTSDSLSTESFAKVLDKSVTDYIRIFI